MTEKVIKNLMNQISGLNSQLRLAQKRTKASDQFIGENIKANLELRTMNLFASDSIVEKDAIIAERDKKIKELNDEIERLNSTMVVMNDAINRLSQTETEDSETPPIDEMCVGEQEQDPA